MEKKYIKERLIKKRFIIRHTKKLKGINKKSIYKVIYKEKD